MMIEKRRQPRFKIDNQVYVCSSSSNDSFLGKLFDISRSGVSFSYVMDFPVPDDFNELGILVPKVGPVLKNLPFYTVYDEPIINDVFVSLVVRRRGGRFHSLTMDQENELGRFIEGLVN